MDRKVPDEEEKKNPTKKKSSSGWHNLSWSTHTHYKIVWFDYDRDTNSMEIEEFICGDNLRKKFFASSIGVLDIL